MVTQGIVGREEGGIGCPRRSGVALLDPPVVGLVAEDVPHAARQVALDGVGETPGGIRTAAEAGLRARGGGERRGVEPDG